MTPRQKIFLNVLATYGRSLYALVLGILTARWALNALGQVDYGLVGVVGGLAGFVTFLNDLLAFSVSRFYAVSVGAETGADDRCAAIEECRKWFNTALLLHATIPLALLAAGYPIGEWAVRHFLTIPLERVHDCVWVWRFTCVSCLVGMASVPFNAMYTAKQDIAELTVYSFITTTLNALFLYYMITHPGVWLFRFALWGCLISVIPEGVKVVRAYVKYPECRVTRKYIFDRPRLKEIGAFGLARFWTMLSNIVSGQGNAILVNKYLGPDYNASMTLGNTVVVHTSTLSAALTGAFSPAIMNAAGEGDPEKVRRLSFQMCRMGALLMLVFAIPLALEIDQVLILWLKIPPPFVAKLVVAILIDSVLERMSEGLYMPIIAFGEGMARYSWWAGWCGMFRFAVAWIFLSLGWGLSAICLALVVARIVVVIMRIHMGRVLAGMSPAHWLRTVLIPICAVIAATSAAGLVTRPLPQSLPRVILTTCACELVFLPVSWLFALLPDERAFVVSRMGRMIAAFRGNDG